MKGKAGKFFFYLIPVVLIAVIIVSGTMFLKDYMEYKRAGDEYESLEALMEGDEFTYARSEAVSDKADAAYAEFTI